MKRNSEVSDSILLGLFRQFSGASVKEEVSVVFIQFESTILVHLAMNTAKLNCFYCPHVSFSTVDQLLSHMTDVCIIRLSRGSNLWPCGNCLRQYDRKKLLKRHTILKHLPNVACSPTLCSNPTTPTRGQLPDSPFRTPVRSSAARRLLLESPTLSPREARKAAPPSSLGEVQTFLCDQLSSLVASFHSNPGMTEKSVQSFVSSFHSFQQDVLYIALHRMLEYQDAVGESCSHLTAFLNSLKIVLEHAIDPLRTIHRRLKHFSTLGTYIPPEPVYFTRHTVRTRTGLEDRPVVGQFVPIRHVLAKLLSIPNLMNEMNEYVESMKDPEGAVCHFMHSPNWRRMLANCPNEDGTVYLPVHLYYDDLEAGNPLGSRAGKNKIGAVYMSLPSLPIRVAVQLRFIFLVMLFRANDKSILRVDTDEEIPIGNNIFKRVVEEMNFLRREGVQVTLTSTQTVTVKFLTGCLLGDNLGLNQICGFVESFSSLHCCRVCTDSYRAPNFIENPATLRNAQNYEEALSQTSHRETGVKERCVWLGIEGFDLFSNINPDQMHDMLEGTISYCFFVIINGLIKHVPLFSLANLNARLREFDFGPESNIPLSARLVAKSGRGELAKLSANECRVFLVYFGLLIGDLVEEFDDDWDMTRVVKGKVVPVVPKVGNRTYLPYEYYDLYLRLIYVHDLITCTRVSDPVVRALVLGIEKLNKAYLKLSDYAHIPPKMHFLIHYPSAMLRNGPSLSLSSMVFERKHRDVKKALTSIASTVNTPLSAAKKVQMQLNNLLVANELPPKRFTPGRLIPAQRSIVEPLVAALNLPFNTTFKETKTIDSPNAITYKIGYVICTKFDDDPIRGVLPSFAKIKNIYICTETNVAVVLAQPYTSLEWSRHFQAYCVRSVRSVEAAIWVNLSELDFPFPNTYCLARNGKEYIVMRNSTSHFIY